MRPQCTRRGQVLVCLSDVSLRNSHGDQHCTHRLFNLATCPAAHEKDEVCVEQTPADACSWPPDSSIQQSSIFLLPDSRCFVDSQPPLRFIIHVRQMSLPHFPRSQSCSVTLMSAPHHPESVAYPARTSSPLTKAAPMSCQRQSQS